MKFLDELRNDASNLLVKAVTVQVYTPSDTASPVAMCVPSQPTSGSPVWKTSSPSMMRTSTLSMNF